MFAAFRVFVRTGTDVEIQVFVAIGIEENGSALFGCIALFPGTGFFCEAAGSVLDEQASALAAAAVADEEIVEFIAVHIAHRECRTAPALLPG